MFRQGLSYVVLALYIFSNSEWVEWKKFQRTMWVAESKDGEANTTNPYRKKPAGIIHSRCTYARLHNLCVLLIREAIYSLFAREIFSSLKSQMCGKKISPRPIHVCDKT